MTTTQFSPEEILRPRFWQAELGLLPVALYGQADERAFVLLNGARGNFCFDVRLDIDEAVARNEIWSADIAYRLALRGDSILVHRWDRASAPLRFEAGDVFAKFERFHRQLELQAPPAELSIVQHALLAFRSLRAALGESVSGEQSLGAYLALLASATDDCPVSAIDQQRWGLATDAPAIAAEISSGEWEGLINLLKQGRRVDGLEPRLPLLLRHASGRLFQEAHYLAAVPAIRQLLIDGFAPDPARILPVSTGVGLHFTPSPLARALVEEALAVLPTPLPDRLSIFDPACGSGEFLREVLRQLALRQYTGAVRLIGWDISPAACAMSRFSLAWEARNATGKVICEIREQDALNADVAWPSDVSCVLMNPPFISWRDMTAVQHARLLEILGGSAHGARPDYAMAFLKCAAASVGDNGVLSAVIPASFLDGTSSAGLRNELGEQLSPILLARLGNQRIFHDASVDPALYVGVRRKLNNDPIAFWADHRPTSASAALRALRRARHVGSVEPVITVSNGYSLYRNSAIGHGAGSWAPRPYEEWRLLKELSNTGVVGDVFAVRQGVITGMNRVFIIGRHELESLPGPEQQYFRPAVLNEAFVAGRATPTGYVFYPYGDAVLATESALQDAMPTFYNTRLRPNREALLTRKRITQDNWWLLSEYRAWQVDRKPKIVTSYFGDVGSFAWDETGDLAIVQGYAWLPKSVLPRSVWLAYVAMLNSPITSSLLAASSNNVGGGQWNLSKRFVARMPLVDIRRKGYSKALVAELAEIGEAIHLGTFSWGDATVHAGLRELTLAAFEAASS